MRLLIIGSPGSGKGTLASIICEQAGLFHLSTGDIFRKNIREKTALGLKAMNYINEGHFVPDELTNEIVKTFLLESIGERGFLLDGYPRTLPQAKFLDAFMSERKLEIDAVIEVVVDQEMIVKRLEGRRVCPHCGASYHINNNPSKTGLTCDLCDNELIHRPDDKRETIEERLRIYHQETEALLDLYRNRGILYQIDNSSDLDQAYEAVREVLGSIKR